MFLARKLRAAPDYRMTAQERKEYEEVRAWWMTNVVLKDGYLVTSNGGPILPGHTWDTLVYEPKARLLIHGTGAYCSDAAVLHSRYHNMPLVDVEKQIDKSYTSIWMFDPARRQWIIHKRPEKTIMPELRGMGATMCYVPDLGRVIYYVAAQNVSPHSYQMWSWDVIRNEWTELKPNGGKALSELVLKDKVAPTEEQQTGYSPKHKKMVAVIGRATFAYDVMKNEWARLNGEVPIEAHDAKTTFAYDSRNEEYLLTDGNKEGKVAVSSLAENKWELVTPNGDGCPPSDWGGGPYWGQPKGYYDPTHNVLVVHGGYTNRVWVYRHK